MPFLLAEALRADGWYLRSDIIWAKPNPMPESVRDRPTKAHEYIFLLTKSPKYWYDADAIAEPSDPKSEARYKCSFGGAKAVHLLESGQVQTRTIGDREYSENRNARTVWTIPTQGYAKAHFATFPPEIPRRCILAGCPPGGVVLDMFAGSGTTGAVAIQLSRTAWLNELNPDYCELIRERCSSVTPGFNFGDVA